MTTVALRQRVMPRYIHMLLKTQGITVSEFVLGQRLMRAHRMLSSPRFVGWTVSAIAYETGFGDPSYFNRTFRRFGATPSEVRHVHDDPSTAQNSGSTDAPIRRVKHPRARVSAN